jgi:hypothetical protein
MTKFFISLSPNPSDGFKLREPTKDEITTKHIAVFEDSPEEAFSLFENFIAPAKGLMKKYKYGQYLLELLNKLF